MYCESVCVDLKISPGRSIISFMICQRNTYIWGSSRKLASALMAVTHPPGCVVNISRLQWHITWRFLPGPMRTQMPAKGHDIINQPPFITHIPTHSQHPSPSLSLHFTLLECSVLKHMEISVNHSVFIVLSLCPCALHTAVPLLCCSPQ